MNAFVILALDHLYLREYIMQLACYTKGKFYKKLKSCYRQVPRRVLV